MFDAVIPTNSYQQWIKPNEIKNNQRKEKIRKNLAKHLVATN